MHNPAPFPDPKVALCALAIDRRAAIRACYNGKAVELHPHQIIDRKGLAYLRAVNPAKARRSDEAPALGLFHLGGLSDLTLCGHGFEPLDRALVAPVRGTDTVLASL